MRVTPISVNWQRNPVAVYLGLTVPTRWPEHLPRLVTNCAAATQFPISLQISVLMDTIAESRSQLINWGKSSKFARAKDITLGPHHGSVLTPQQSRVTQLWPRDNAAIVC